MIGTQARLQMAEQLWLQYFNRTLCQRGVISDVEMRRMQLLIQHRTKQIPKK